MTDQQPVVPADDEIDLAELAGKLWDHHRLIIAITLSVFVIACLYALMATRIYQADSLLQIENKAGILPGMDQFGDLFGGKDSITQTEIQIITSRLVLGSAADQLKMDITVAPQQGWLDKRLFPQQQGDAPIVFAGWNDDNTLIRIARLSVPDALIGQPMQLEVGDNNHFSLYNAEHQVLIENGSVKKLLRTDNGLMLRINELNAPAGTTFVVTKRPRQKLLQAFKQKLSITESGKGTNILSLSYTDPLPQRAVAVLDAVDQNYLLQNIERSTAQAEKSLEFVNQQLPEIKQDLNAAEDKLNAYRKKSESVDVTLKTKTLMEQLVDIDSKLNELKLKESEVASHFTKAHPTYRSLLEQRGSLQQDKEDLENRIGELPQTQQDILRIMRDVESNKQTFELLLAKSQELKIAKASTVGNVRIIDKAVAKVDPIKPKRPLIAAVGLLLGLMLSIGFVLLRMALHRGLETPEQIEQLGLPVYATLPLSLKQQKQDQQRGAKRQRHQAKFKRFLLSEADPGDPAIEALRSLRTSLHFAMLETSNRVMITGASPGAGKSFVSANLAAVLSKSGQKVLLIDADLRRGHLGGVFAMDRKTAGLSDYLSGKNELKDSTHSTFIKGLDLIPKGQIPPNPSELLMHPRMEALLAQASNDYDLILVDTPPILAVTDAAIVGQNMGACLLLARYSSNTSKEIEAAWQRFEKSGVPIKGCIFNGIERQSNNYYYYDYNYRSEK